MDKRIGIIGVGLVGTAMAERLLAAGYSVVGRDPDPARMEALRALGGAAGDPAECSRVILSLPASDISARVVEDLPPGCTVIDTTTGEPEEMAAIGARLAARGIAYLDATIGGSSRQVREGDAIMLVGGEAAAFAACRDVFEACSRRVF